MVSRTTFQRPMQSLAALLRRLSLRPETRQGSPLDSLPEEILLLILHCLSLADLIACQKVCRRLVRAIRTDLSLQYKMELEENGMIDGSLVDMPVAEKLVRLRKYVESLRTGSVAASSSYSTIRADNTSEHTWEAETSYDNSITYMVRDQHNKATAFVVHSLPSVTFGISARRWSVPIGHVSDTILRGTVDLSQNLLVLSERVAGSWNMRTHLLSVESGGPHPSATQPFLPPAAFDQSDEAFLIHIYGLRVRDRYVAWGISPSGSTLSHVEVWDWKAGSLVWHHHYNARAVFALFEDGHIIVASTPGQLDIYQLALREGIEHTESEAATGPRRVCSLGMPPMHHSRHIEISHLSTSMPYSPTPLPFQMDPASSVVVVNFSVMFPSLRSRILPPRRCVLIIPQETIRRCISRTQQLPSSRPDSVLHWLDWGPGGTVLLGNTHNPWRRSGFSISLDSYPFGSTFPILVEALDGSCGKVIVLQLSKWAARRARHRHGMAIAPTEAQNDLTLLGLHTDMRNPFETESTPGTDLPLCGVYPAASILFPSDNQRDDVSMCYGGFVVNYIDSTEYRASGFEVYAV
ncbi:hypothetical protein C8Q80DRAFT_1163391 [Daedaleopsis nitida]|nr:hypothetical protein C8Q80DRAFT_1163391 [Daedaleopsis nitida]